LSLSSIWCAAAFEVTDPESLARTISRLLGDMALIEQHAMIARTILANQSGVVERIMEVIEPTLKKIQKHHAA